MSEDSERANRTQATPNRGPRHEPPTIDAEPIATGQTKAKAQPRPTMSLLSLLPATAALLVSVAALYYSIIDEAPQPAPAASPDSVIALAQRLEKVEARIATFESRPAPSLPALPPPVDLTPLEKRIAAAETSAESARRETIRLRDSLQNAPPAQMAPQAAPQIEFDIKPVEERIARLESELNDMRASLAAPKTQMRATEAPNVPASSANEAAALAAIAASLTQKIDKGAPLAREIAALEKIGADAARIAALRPFANGAPTSIKLAQEFSAQSSAMLRTLRPPEGDGDLLDRMARSASSLVRVRPIGETMREDAPALIARIEATLQRADVVEAMSLFAKLPKETQDAARDFSARAHQRAAADLAIRQLVDSSIERLAGK
ncbi:MAG: hypothetical protein RL735_1382 [Pseudomonadota bacterium]